MTTCDRRGQLPPSALLIFRPKLESSLELARAQSPLGLHRFGLSCGDGLALRRDCCSETCHLSLNRPLDCFELLLEPLRLLFAQSRNRKGLRTFLMLIILDTYAASISLLCLALAVMSCLFLFLLRFLLLTYLIILLLRGLLGVLLGLTQTFLL